MITAGTYKARVSGECVIGTAKTGTPFIQFYFTILEGDHKGSRVKWTGYFTENTNVRTRDSLRLCGWQGDELEEFGDGALHGLDASEVEIVVELEPYEGNDEKYIGKSFAKVAWVNRAGGFLDKTKKMDDGALSAFSAKMRGLMMGGTKVVAKPAAKPAARVPSPAPTSDLPEDEIPF